MEKRTKIRIKYEVISGLIALIHGKLLIGLTFAAVLFGPERAKPQLLLAALLIGGMLIWCSGSVFGQWLGRKMLQEFENNAG